MATNTLQYLDPDGLGETVLNIAQIKTSLEGQISDLGESLEEAMQNLPYARPDGIYPDMTIGAVIGADSTAQWATRESTGSGKAIVRSVQGAAVVWNQLIQVTDATRTSNGVTFVSSADGTVVANGEATGNTYATNITDIPITVGHVYLLKGAPSGGSQSTYRAYIQGDPFSGVSNRYDYGEGVIVAAVASGTASIVPLYIYSGYTANNLVVIPQLFDLTQMFGSGNEPQTVAEFEAMYPEAYYPYSAPTLKPVQIAGVRSTDAQGGELDSIEWTAQTLRAAGSVADMLYADHVDVRVGVVDLGTLNWNYRGFSGGSFYAFHALFDETPAPSSFATVANLKCAEYSTVKLTEISNTDKCVTYGTYWLSANNLYIRDDAYTDAATFKAAMNGVLLYYELATPTTTPISPALPMTYKVQQGGSESIIVLDGEISAAPVLTIAEPVNTSTELARIWAAIEQLQSRGTAQLSRPVSLADVVNVDDTQKDTEDVAEIDTIKEVQE